jgi:hypothetical protein
VFAILFLALQTAADRGDLPNSSQFNSTGSDWQRSPCRFPGSPIPMSKTVSTLLCGVILFLQSTTVVPQNPINHGGKIETKYDGFAFETVMRLQKMKVNCNGFKGNFKDYCVSIDVALHCPGIQLNHVKNVTLQLLFETRSWDEPHPANQRELSVVADTVTLRLGKMRLIRRPNAVMQETMVETLEATIPYDVFKRLAQSQSIEFQVGNDKVGLSDKNLAALRDLNNRVLQSQR